MIFSRPAASHGLLPALAAALLAACAAPGAEPRDSVAVVEATPEVREPLFAALAALEGQWTGEGPSGPATTTFEVSSNGSAIRERMLVGTPMEMTNMYTLDGDSLQMTHYCAAGNQPHMRAVAMEGNRLAFAPTGVSDLKESDGTYMGAMTIEFVDENTIREHWTSMGPEAGDHDIVIELKRADG